MTEENQNPNLEVENEEEVVACDTCESDPCICCPNCGLPECVCCPDCGRYKCVCKQYYIDFDELGNIDGFYLNLIHGDSIPESAIPISEDDWKTYSSDASKYKLDGDTIREKTQQELDDEAAAIPPREPTKIEILETENAELWYEVMLEKSRNDDHDADISELWYEMMMGGVGA